MCVKNIQLKFYSTYHLVYVTLSLLLTISILSNPAWGNNAAFTIVRSDAESIDLHVNVPFVNFDRVAMDGRVWDSLRISEYYTTTEPGAPQLPVIATLVSIPWGMNGEIQAMETGNPRVMQGYRVCPNEEHEGRFAFDANIYSRDELYPGNVAELSQPSGFRDHWVVRVVIYPVQYNP